ncbi:hypothetical protein Taro_048474 [Colocasia esculenta]|uniref:Uncharacterized protein n=1 Tax=Colocasia esculenta TaxID=4460 RepID=A0A843X882_COLES|nr:hypothetical protein [Colocasia esculenta]
MAEQYIVALRLASLTPDCASPVTPGDPCSSLHTSPVTPGDPCSSLHTTPPSFCFDPTTAAATAAPECGSRLRSSIPLPSRTKCGASQPYPHNEHVQACLVP